jgi:two-component system, chemotaxis family, protein-glutamate methylesterase/glutaminase
MMAGHHIVVIGASAGGVEALAKITKQLPTTLDAAVFVAMHFPAHSVSLLPDILNRAHTLLATHPQDGDPIQPGHIYIAPPDYHLLIQPDTIRLSHGPKENGHRPAIDALFRSAAQAYGSAVVGVVLTGMLDDGTSGLRAIKAQGGVALVQDPAEALFSSMPESAIAKVEVDQVLPLAALVDAIVELVSDAVDDSPAVASSLIDEAARVAQEKAAAEEGDRSNAASPLTCPDCGGVLWELRDGDLLRFRCHVGHAYSMEGLMTEQSNTLERALWVAVRTLEEKASLSRRLAAQAQAQNRPNSLQQFSQRATQSEQNARLIRQIILHQPEMQADPSLTENRTLENQ